MLEAELGETLQRNTESRVELEALEEAYNQLTQSVSFLEDRLHQLENLDIAPFTLPPTAIDAEPPAKRRRTASKSDKEAGGSGDAQSTPTTE
ncbi:hypothetical protein QCA50_010291 [Cerrena zonata]|uniref:Uncharacterized protein n=1 Tax=Cerrena zonata TaxID=2478898 RepID=A0AAW0G0D0_9APHY